MREFVRRAKFEIRDLLGQYSALVPILAVKSSWRHVMVRPDSAVCIEGYPRSANTFSVAAFSITNPECGHIARHTHLSGQVLRAISYGVPTLVLLREPEDAVLSMKIREPDLSVSQLLRSYIRYYRCIERVRGDVCIATFEEVTDDFGKVLCRMNDELGTTFNLFHHDEAGTESAFAEVEQMFEDYQKRMGIAPDLEGDRIAKPTEARKALKANLKQELNSDTNRNLLSRARQKFSTFSQ